MKMAIRCWLDPFIFIVARIEFLESTPEADYVIRELPGSAAIRTLGTCSGIDVALSACRTRIRPKSRCPSSAPS